MFGIQKPLYMRKQQENKERELILGFVHLTTDITVKGSLREIPHTDQLFADLCENRVSSVFHKLLFRVTTVAYESHYVFVSSSLHCVRNFIVKNTFFIIGGWREPLDGNIPTWKHPLYIRTQ